MPKLIDPIYMKTGSTDVLIGSSTGGLYQEGVALPHSTQLGPLALVTWPTTAAQTLVNTTSVQSLTNKTVNNITITDPGSAATLTISSGGTLEAFGAFQHKFTAAANSAVTLPSATDALLMWTTEASGKITAKTSDINVIGVITWPSTTAFTVAGTTAIQGLTNKTLNGGSSPSTTVHTLVSTTDAQTLQNKTLGLGTVQNTETGSTATSLVNYGVSLLSYSSDAGNAYTLSAPALGVRKVLALQTTAVPDTTGIFSSVYTGSTAIFIMDNSTTYAPKLYAGFGPPYARIELEGHSTALWGVVSAYGNAKLSTSAVFST